MKTNKGQSAQIVSIPAPVGGINSEVSISEMPSNYAIEMENLFPESSSVKVRGGRLERNYGVFTGPIRTIAPYNGLTSSKLFCISESDIYNITANGAPVLELATGSATSYFQFCQMATIGGRFLLMFSGSVQAKLYDGTVWSTIGFGGGATQISGVDTASIINCNIYKSRLYMVEKNTANVWYLPVNSIYGAATKLDFSSLLKKGSFIVTMSTWAVDNSNGLQEYAVFISNFGEVLVYQGSDPSVATDFKLSSQFVIGKPLSYRCTEKIGSDIVIICDDGAYPLSKALLSEQYQKTIALTNNINNLISSDIEVWRDLSAGVISQNSGRWQILHYPQQNKLYINVVKGENDFDVAFQYVMNTTTGAWCKYTGWDIFSIGIFNDKLILGDRIKTYTADLKGANSDEAGVRINITCRQAFNNLGSANRKQITSLRAIVNSNALKDLPFKLNFDYGNQNTAFIDPGAGGIAPKIKTNWLSSNVLAFIVSPTIKTNRQSGVFEWFATDLIFKTGGML
jgi:hypothetical protein